MSRSHKVSESREFKKYLILLSSLRIQLESSSSHPTPLYILFKGFMLWWINVHFCHSVGRSVFEKICRDSMTIMNDPAEISGRTNISVGFYLNSSWLRVVGVVVYMSHLLSVAHIFSPVWVINQLHFSNFLSNFQVHIQCISDSGNVGSSKNRASEKNPHKHVVHVKSTMIHVRSVLWLDVIQGSSRVKASDIEADVALSLIDS